MAGGPVHDEFNHQDHQDHEGVSRGIRVHDASTMEDRDDHETWDLGRSFEVNDRAGEAATRATESFVGTP